MGLWGNSNTTTEIQKEIGYINDYLCKMENNVTRHKGINIQNAETIAEYFMKTLSHQQNAQSLMNKLSDRELNNLTLRWMDGRYLPFHLWNSSYQLVMQQIKGGLDRIDVF